jgi:hypothetical protein
MLSDWLGIAYEMIDDLRRTNKNRYLLNVWDESGLENGSFDHRCIQEHHDIIAATYRKIAKHEMTVAGALAKELKWKIFFNKIAKECLEQEDGLESFVEALAFPNTDRGSDAEDILLMAVQAKCDEYEPDTSRMDSSPNNPSQKEFDHAKPIISTI